LVVATAGTTSAGVIDSLERVAAVCRKHGVWFHVDAAWGGAAILGPRLAPYLRGIEMADSITCDAHKWFNVTMGAGMFLCREGGVLEEAFRVSTDYMPGLTEGAVDSFVTSAQWSRRFIGLKLFVALASRGERGYAEMIEGQSEVGDYMKQRLAQTGWVHLSRSPLPICCVSHPRIDSGKRSVETVLETVLGGGKAWISKVNLGNRFALRACVTSCSTTRNDVDVLVDEMNAAVGSSAGPRGGRASDVDEIGHQR
jgi:glutamate/tyrosine decarboxylase-like PLP-dependent enzyme